MQFRRLKCLYVCRQDRDKLASVSPLQGHEVFNFCRGAVVKFVLERTLEWNTWTPIRSMQWHTHKLQKLQAVGKKIVERAVKLHHFRLSSLSRTFLFEKAVVLQKIQRNEGTGNTRERRKIWKCRAIEFRRDATVVTWRFLYCSRPAQDSRFVLKKNNCSARLKTLLLDSTRRKKLQALD